MSKPATITAAEYQATGGKKKKRGGCIGGAKNRQRLAKPPLVREASLSLGDKQGRLVIGDVARQDEAGLYTGEITIIEARNEKRTPWKKAM